VEKTERSIRYAVRKVENPERSIRYAVRKVENPERSIRYMHQNGAKWCKIRKKAVGCFLTKKSTIFVFVLKHAKNPHIFEFLFAKTRPFFVAFATKNVAFATKNVAFATKNVAFATKNVAFATKIQPFSKALGTSRRGFWLYIVVNSLIYIGFCIQVCLYIYTSFLIIFYRIYYNYFSIIFLLFFY